MDTLYADLLRELECPVCTDYMPPPIRQCKTGHSICAKCITKLMRCPLCQQCFTEARNTNLESLATKMQYPCVNNSNGCQSRLTLAERDFHDKVCPYKKYSCPMNGCSFAGNKIEIKDHWNSKKLTNKPYGKKSVCHNKIKADSYFVNLVDAYNENFWFKSKTKQGKIYWAVQYIGDSNKAADYYFEIEVFKAGLPKKRIIYSDYCKPIEVNIDDLLSNNDCPYTTFDYLNNYIGNDQLLIYYFRIFKAEKTSDDKQEVLKQENSKGNSANRSTSQNRGGGHKKGGQAKKVQD